MWDTLEGSLVTILILHEFYQPMNRCQTCGDSFTRYSEQNSQFLLLFLSAFMEVKKQQNPFLPIIFLPLIQSLLATSDDLLAFFQALPTSIACHDRSPGSR